MANRKFQIDLLIINSPYEEPSTHWSYGREVRMFERKDGRRPAGAGVAAPICSFRTAGGAPGAKVS